MIIKIMRKDKKSGIFWIVCKSLMFELLKLVILIMKLFSSVDQVENVNGMVIVIRIKRLKGCC